MAPARKAAKKTTKKATAKTAAKSTARKATKKATKKKAAKKTAAKKAPAKRKTATKRAGAKAAPAVVTLKHMAADLAEAHEMPKRQAEEFLGEFVDMMTTHLKKGAKLRLSGLGIFQVRHRPARMGRNPATGESIRIKASKKVAFRVAKDLKEAV
ncbi:MAG: HU family DNA-binding protein [Parvularculaceae bacterium]